MDIAIIDKFLAGFAGKELHLDANGIKMLAGAADGVIRQLDLKGVTVSIFNADGRWAEVGYHLDSELEKLEEGDIIYMMVRIDGPGKIYFIRAHRPDKDRYKVSVAKGN